MLGSVVGLSRAVGGEEQQSLALLRLDFQGLAVQAQVLEHRAAAVLDVVEVHQQGRDALPAVGEVCGQQLLRQRVAVPAELLPEAVSHHLRLLHLRQPDFRHQAQRLFHERLAVAEVQEPRRRRPVTSRVRGERLGRHFIPFPIRRGGPQCITGRAVQKPLYRDHRRLEALQLHRVLAKGFHRDLHELAVKQAAGVLREVLVSRCRGNYHRRCRRIFLEWQVNSLLQSLLSQWQNARTGVFRRRCGLLGRSSVLVSGAPREGFTQGMSTRKRS
mmetsp:Transcript_2368/g.10089  ORF Transcript_2368/g.10089 Transcript_2368/m.10089 type:complete len:273 (-) Transcript_2368:106-924(-)